MGGWQRGVDIGCQTRNESHRTGHLAEELAFYFICGGAIGASEARRDVLQFCPRKVTPATVQRSWGLRGEKGEAISGLFW